MASYIQGEIAARSVLVIVIAVVGGGLETYIFEL